LSSELFVGHNPYSWPSCRDALEYTWTYDLGEDIIGAFLPLENRQGSIRNMIASVK
jgi:hypothetical protein